MQQNRKHAKFNVLGAYDPKTTKTSRTLEIMAKQNNRFKLQTSVEREMIIKARKKQTIIREK